MQPSSQGPLLLGPSGESERETEKHNSYYGGQNASWLISK